MRGTGGDPDRAAQRIFCIEQTHDDASQLISLDPAKRGDDALLHAGHSLHQGKQAVEKVHASIFNRTNRYRKHSARGGPFERLLRQVQAIIAGYREPIEVRADTVIEPLQVMQFHMGRGLQHRARGMQDGCILSVLLNDVDHDL